jgi:hypothetical protein
MRPGPTPPIEAEPSTTSESEDRARSTSSPENALWTQQRLHQLGFLSRKPNGIWDNSSRQALREFKIVNGLSPDSVWDFQTEKRIGLSGARTSNQSFVGSWSDRTDCIISQASAAPLRIDTIRAVSTGGRCEFQTISKAGESWKIKARCFVDADSWPANIKLIVDKDRLTWSSERGTEEYFRCK